MADFFMGFDEPKGMRGFAQSTNMRYVEGELDRQYAHDVPGGLPDMPMFKNGDRSKIPEMCYGTFGGLPCQVFTFDCVLYREDPGHDRRTCVLFSVPANFATLSVSPHSKLSRLQERNRDPFAERFRVVGRDPDAVQLLLDDGMRRWLMTVDPHLRIEFHGSAILGHSRETDPDDLPLLVQQLYGVYLRIPDVAWDRYGILV
jgi:hypothetical protein